MLPFATGYIPKGEMKMTKSYENVEIEVIFFCYDDIIRTSQNDNVQDLPDFPEFLG